MDNLSVHNRQHTFTSTTNLNLNEHSSRRPQQQQQQNSRVRSTPYLSQIHDNEPSTLKSSFQQQQTDRHSTVGSDSGIVMVNANSHHRRQQQQQQQQQPPQQYQSDENHFVEKTLSDVVQQFRKQLESDAQKINEKLELKLKNLEDMIHQQTFVIRRQDEVVERLKNKILKIESERDHFRERLSAHEQDEKKTPSNESEHIYEENIQANRQYSNGSTSITDHSKPSTKKVGNILELQVNVNNFHLFLGSSTTS
jgi:hypothetical protein